VPVSSNTSRPTRSWPLAARSAWSSKTACWITSSAARTTCGLLARLWRVPAAAARIAPLLETSLPDQDGRRRLLRLYARDIEVEPEAEEELVTRTAGVTGAFIKELMRQAVLRAATRAASANSTDVRATLEQLLDERETLTRRLLGQPAGDAHGRQDAPPLPAMARALRISGLPTPPDV